MPHCPELSPPHSGPLPAEETKLGRTETKAGEGRVECSEPPWRLSVLLGAPAPPGVRTAVLPAFQGSQLHGSCPVSGLLPLSVHVSEHKAPTVQEPYLNEMSLKSGAEIIVSLLGQACLKQAGKRKR